MKQAEIIQITFEDLAELLKLERNAYITRLVKPTYRDDLLDIYVSGQGFEISELCAIPIRRYVKND